MTTPPEGLDMDARPVAECRKRPFDVAAGPPAPAACVVEPPSIRADGLGDLDVALLLEDAAPLRAHRCPRIISWEVYLLNLFPFEVISVEIASVGLLLRA
jgi:hypothetical protein